MKRKDAPTYTALLVISKIALPITVILILSVILLEVKITAKKKEKIQELNHLSPLVKEIESAIVEENTLDEMIKPVKPALPKNATASKSSLILLIGFPKSGTTSFTYLFDDLGYRTYHWAYNTTVKIGNVMKKLKRDGKKLLSWIPKGKNNNVAVTQMDVCIRPDEENWPQITDFRQLYIENKNAIFILNKRDPAGVYNSFKNWNTLDKRIFTYSGYLFDGLPGNTEEEKFLNLVELHYERVETFFARQKTAKFLTYDIEKDDIGKLSKYIDLKGITEFPKRNVNTWKE